VIHSRAKTETAIHDNPRSGIAESYRGIRTNLKFMLTNESQKIISVQSTNPGEGKSFTSVNLATILAMNEKKVLLIGTDMRKPKVHKIFKIENEHGLSTFLSGQDRAQDVIVPTFIDNLEVIPGGPIPPNPSELLDKPELGKMIQELSINYDYILLDNAPVSLVTDGLLAGRHADLNIFILRYGVSKKDQIDFINQIAEKKILGNMALIINDIKGPGFGYGKNYSYNYRYSGYGHGYYYQEDISFHKSWFRRLQRIRK
jgi:capsular exopolysaccharide synthesis family protein